MFVLWLARSLLSGYLAIRILTYNLRTWTNFFLSIVVVVENLIPIDSWCQHICFIIIVVNIMIRVDWGNHLFPSLMMCTLNSFPFLFKYRLHLSKVLIILIINIWLEIHIHWFLKRFIIILTCFCISMGPFACLISCHNSWLRLHVRSLQSKTSVCIYHFESICRKLFMMYDAR